jgi:ribosomal protein S18 acetylase RimI-like enzyme
MVSPNFIFGEFRDYMVKKIFSIFVFSFLVINVPAQALTWDTFCSFFKKKRPVKYQDPKSLKFYDYVEERDLKNIEQLCAQNTQSLFGKQFEGKDSETCARNIQTRMQSSQESTEKPSWVKLEFHRTYIKTLYCGSEFVGFVMYGWPSAFGTPSGKSFMQGTIDLLVVEEKFRQKGFGHLLLDIAITEMRQKGAELIELCVLPDNQQAIEFYKKNGFICVPTPYSENVVTMVRLFTSELNELLETMKAQGMLV